MPDDLLTPARDQAERSEPGVRGAAFLRIARVESVVDPGQGRKTFERALSEIRQITGVDGDFLLAHARLVASDPNYAGQVQRGETVKWADPAQDMTMGQNIGDPATPIGTRWYCSVTPRCESVLTPAERAGKVADGVIGTDANVVPLVRVAT